MWKRISLLMCVCVLLISCTPKEPAPAEQVQEEVVAVAAPVQEETAVAAPAPEPEVPARTAPAHLDMDVDALMQEHPDTPSFWSVELQKTAYDIFFWNEDYDSALAFRAFTESLTQYHDGEAYYVYNPVFLCYERYPELIPLVFEACPNLFLRDPYQPETEGSPFAYAVKNLTLEDVKFYFEHDIPCVDVSDFDQYGSLNRGGSRFGIGGNIITYAEKQEIRDYLVMQGVPSVVKASRYQYNLKDTVSVYNFPGSGNLVVATLSKETMINATEITAYQIEGCQWVKITFDGREGWVPATSVKYSTGA